MTVRLLRYDAARHALRVATQVDDVKDIRDKAEAMEAYARQIGDTELEEWVHEIKLRAERKLGELLAETERAKGGRKPKIEVIESLKSTPYLTPSGAEGVSPPTLKDLKITEKQSSNYQAIAAIAEEKFEEIIANGKATTASLVRASPKKGNGQAKPRKPKAPKPVVDTVPKSEYDELSEKYDELREEFEQQAAALDAVAAFREDKHVKRIEDLQKELRIVERTRDDSMAKLVNAEKRSKYWQKEAEKLGWKPKDKHA